MPDTALRRPRLARRDVHAERLGRGRALATRRRRRAPNARRPSRSGVAICSDGMGRSARRARSSTAVLRVLVCRVGSGGDAESRSADLCRFGRARRSTRSGRQPEDDRRPDVARAQATMPIFVVSLMSATSAFSSRSASFLNRTQALPMPALGSGSTYRSAT